MAKTPITLTLEYLNRLFLYNPETGIVTSRLDRPPKIKTGQELGWKDTRGYLQVKIDGRGYLLHRIIWFMVTGYWPPHDIDHKDRNKTNNKWSICASQPALKTVKTGK